MTKVSELGKLLSLASQSETTLKHSLKKSEAELLIMQEELAKLNKVLASVETENKWLTRA